MATFHIEGAYVWLASMPLLLGHGIFVLGLQMDVDGAHN